MGCWSFDTDAGKAWYDRRCAQICGLDGSEISLTDFEALVEPEDRPAVMQAVDDAIDPAQRRPYDVQCRIRRRSDGELRWIAARGLVTFSEPEEPGELVQVCEFVGTVLDITEWKRTAEALERSNTQLRRADDEKNRFLAMLAHELRNPLAPIRSAVEILRLRPTDVAMVRRVYDIVTRQVNHMARLVDDLIDLSRITRGSIALQQKRLDLSQLARNTIEPLRFIAERAGLSLELRIEAEPLIMNGDPTRLAQCLSNLVSNAIKFTPGGGHIEVTLRRQGRNAVVEVADDGIGIDPEHLEPIFDMFFQAQPSGVNGTTGLGIGLALTRTLVMRHGGRIRASSAGLGQGSRFTIELPALDA